MYSMNRPPTPHPMTDTVLIGKKIVKTKNPQQPKPNDHHVVIEEPPQKISQ